MKNRLILLILSGVLLIVLGGAVNGYLTKSRRDPNKAIKILEELMKSNGCVKVGNAWMLSEGRIRSLQSSGVVNYTEGTSHRATNAVPEIR
jgi:hypothetical protein